jgi:glycosyltransferase involved in cell wall biosynthesis
MSPPRVTHVAVIHDPLDTRIFRRECRTLAGAGWDVHLVVPGPPGQEIDGVRFHSVAADRVRPPLRRQWARQWRAARWAGRLRPSVFHLHEPHLIPLGLVLRLAGARVIYDVHEDYRGHALSKHFRQPVRGRLKALVWKVLEGLARRAFDRVVCASPLLAERFPAGPTEVIGNFPRPDEIPLAEAVPYRERPTPLLYVGVMREIRALAETLQALELVPDDLDCRLRMIGSFRPPELIETARRGRIELVPWRPFSEVGHELLAARVGLVLLYPLPNHQDPARSRKLFEYMAAGVPVIASDLPRWRELVHGLRCGLVVDPRDPEAIAGAIERLLRDPEEAEAMGRRGRAAVESTFNWDAEARRLLDLYRGLPGSPFRPRPAARAPERISVP